MKHADGKRGTPGRVSIRLEVTREGCNPDLPDKARIYLHLVAM